MRDDAVARAGTMPAPAEPEQQADGLVRWVERARQAGRRPARPAAPVSQRLLLVTGGKGGVGKSSFSLNFGLALAELGRRVLLVDCDSGLGSLDVLLGLCPSRHLGHVLAGECAVADALMTISGGVRLLPAASGLESLGNASGLQAMRLIKALGQLDGLHDICLLDSGAGLGPLVRALLRAAAEMVVVTTPEPTALTDAYATLKTIRRGNRAAEVALVMNMAETARDAEDAASRLAAVCGRYLEWTPRYLGWVPRDAAVGRAVRAQRPLLLEPGASPAAAALRRLAVAYVGDVPTGGGRKGLRDVLLAFLRSRPAGRMDAGSGGGGAEG